MVVSIAPTAAAAQEAAWGQVTAAALNVRGGPGETFDVVGSLGYGVRVQLEGRSADGYWILVNAPEQGVRGWATAFFITPEGSASLLDLPVTGENAPSAEQVAEAAPAQPAVTVSSGAAYTTGNLNMRSSPDAGSLFLTALAPQTALILEARDTSGAWALARTPDNRLRGWVAAGYLTPGEGVDIGALPVSVEQAFARLYEPDPAAVTTGPTDPIVPVVTARAREIYLAGQAMGNDPHWVSMAGDCHSAYTVFLTPFAGGSYNLGSYTYLQDTINHFASSFGRPNVTARAGFLPASILDPVWADPTLCNAGETPLACEFRIHRPSVFFINFGSDAYEWDQFRQDMRTIIEFSIAHGAIPILGTKADNREGDYWINLFIAELAAEYDIPLWNYWFAIQGLPDATVMRGDDDYHISWGHHDFRILDAFQNGGSVRNLTALMALDAVWRGAMY
jgi:uncharacterized protein YraI